MSIARHHAEWLSLIEVSGPFLSLPVLKGAFPQGLPARDPEVSKESRLRFEDWQNQEADRAVHRRWCEFVLGSALQLPPETLAEGGAIPPGMEARIAEFGEVLRPDLAVVPPAGAGSKKTRMLVQICPPDQDLEKPLKDRHWKASPATRMTELLHAADVRLGLITNGEHWMLVHAPRGETTGIASWYAPLWFEEPLTFQAFRALLGAQRFFGVPEKESLEALLTASAQDQQEVTEQLGWQVRRAVEVLIQAFDRLDQDSNRRLLAGVDEKQLYEAALTVMMRLVFLFAAEERGLLLLGDPLYDQHYAVSTLRDQLQEAADKHVEEVLDSRFDAWSRLLATFRTVYGGVQHEAMRLPPYGGSLFHPDRFPFLEGRRPESGWRTTPAEPLKISNRTVLHLLNALQVLQVRVTGGGPAEARRLSFRALDIEQIGHVYEGLLDHTAVRATEPVLGLKGAKDSEAEVPLSKLEDLAGVVPMPPLQPEGVSQPFLLAAETPTNVISLPKAKGVSSYSPPEKLIEFLKEETGRSANAIKKALTDQSGVDESRLLLACGHDRELVDRVWRFAPLLRDDTFGLPVVIRPGSIYVTQGTTRRSTGTHYTPRSLTEPIVRYTLEPLVYVGPAEGKRKEEWQLKSAREILELKVCDIAMGSGAFLVQACRYLGERLVEAWENAEKAHPGQFIKTPEGEISTGAPSERLLPYDAAERLAIARRYVADRCLYGVDINPMAVEMAKLSLWLITLQRDRPFTFVDHAFKCGDSLLGVSSVKQIENYSLRAKEGEAVQHTFATANLFRCVDEATEKRRALENLPSNDHTQIEAKNRLHAEAEAVTAKVKALADCLIAFELCGLNGEEYEDRRAVAADQAEAAMRKPLSEFQTYARHQVRSRQPFQWPVEFPEVFARGGFDAVSGNPPFIGGKKITGTLGTDYRDYLVERLARGQRGHADLCAYFFLRAHGLLRPDGGILGLVATNTIAQGDTREVGIELLLADSPPHVLGPRSTPSLQEGSESSSSAKAISVKRGEGDLLSTIIRAVASTPWPGEAALEVAHVWLRRGAWVGHFQLNDRTVRGITPFLVEEGAVRGKPFRLAVNTSKSFIGTYVLGMGFVLTPGEAEALIAKNPRNRDVLFPYLNGEDLNSRPDQSPSRWVINFRDWPMEQAEQYPDCFAIVREAVKPERTRKTPDGEYKLRWPLHERWWIYADKRPALYATINSLPCVLVATLVSKHLSWTFAQPGIVFAHKCCVVAFGNRDAFALLQSTVHEVWSREYCSTLETRLNYSPSDAFETFPFPPAHNALSEIGHALYEFRSSLMQQRREGLTKTYNRLHNANETSADIVHLRTLHATMDQAVAAAYGWTDLNLGHGFHETKQGVRYTISESARRTVLDRLLALNHQRYEEEVKAGLHEKRRSKAPTKKKPTAPLPAARELDFGAPATATPAQDAAIFALSLIPFLLSEASRTKASLRMTELKRAFDFITNPSFMEAAAKPEHRMAVETWSIQWVSPAGPEWFIKTLRKLAGGTVRATTDEDDPPMMLVVAPTQPNSHLLREGVRLAVLLARTTTALPPEDKAGIIRERRSIFTTV
jgi:hypothetical protein